MTLADELRGITPRVTVPGRIVAYIDPEEYGNHATERTQTFDAWAKGRVFLVRDAADALGIDIKAVQSLCMRGLRLETLVRMGRTEKGRLYRCVSVSTAEAAAKAHFG